MTVRTVLRMGDPDLQRVSTPVETVGRAALEPLVTDLWDTMHATGGIGLAAPQIGVALRVVVFGREDQAPGERAIAPTVLVNPVIEPLADELVEGWEGCLSLPGMRGLVPRHRRIRYSGLDLDGSPIEREVSDFHARVVQHECDHLDGVLYPMRMRDLSQFGFEEQLEAAGRLVGMRCDDS